MAGLTSLAAVKWGQMVAESQASVHQGTGPVPPPTGSWHMARLHQVGSVCCERPPGVPRGSSSDHGRRRARLSSLALVRQLDY